MQKYGYFTTFAKKSKTFLEINGNIWAPKKWEKAHTCQYFFILLQQNGGSINYVFTYKSHGMVLRTILK
jgi:hypothetical protein